jgi:hypothetical protein
MQTRHRFKQTSSLHDRLASFAKEMRDKASLMPPSPEKDHLLKKASRADMASDIDDWANSAGLLLPK